MKRPKIAVVHPGIGSGQGGAQTFVLELTERLKDRCDITILSAKKANELCKPVFCVSRGDLTKTKNPFWRLIIDFLGKFTNIPEIAIESLTSFFPIFFELLFNRYDILYPNNSTAGLLVCSLVRKIKGTPIIFTQHESQFDNTCTRDPKFKPNKYIALNKEYCASVKKQYPELDVIYIPNGVDLKRFSPGKSNINLDLQKPIVLAVGRNTDIKRLDLAIDAASKLSNISLLIISTGENLDELEAKGNALIGTERFKLIRNVNQEEVQEYYKLCDVFTLPSEREPFGLVYLEALACNKPIVAPDDVHRNELLGNSAVLCGVTNAEEYASAIEKAVSTNFGETPINRAREFSWEICADRYYEVIESLC